MIYYHYLHCTKNEVSIKDFFSKYGQIHRKLGFWSHLLKKSLIGNFILSAVLPLHLPLRKISGRVFPELCQTSKIECFAKKMLTAFSC